MIRLMELTMNQANMNLGNANAEWGSTGWRMPEFGFQKYVAEAVKSIFHTIHSSFDYHSKATTRELLVFLVYAVVLQGVLIPTESYTTLHADVSSRTCRPHGLHHSRRRLGVEMDKKPFETSIIFLPVAGKNVTLQS